MQKIMRNPDVLWREETFDDTADTPPEDTVAAILFADGQMLSLNELGTEIWKLCDQQTVDEVVASLLLEFEVAEEVVRGDVVLFLDELAKKGFIRYE